MAQPQKQYAPVEILDLGRRAEADGRLDYALQLFHYLTEHYPGTPEAATASEALSRHQQSRPDSGERARDAFQYAPNGSARGGAAARQPHQSPSAPQPASTSGQTAKRGKASGGRRQSQLQLEPVASNDVSERPGQAPGPAVRRYLLGRALAVVIIAIGAITMASGAGLIAAVFIAPKFIDQATIGAAAWLTLLVSAAMVGFGAALTLAGLAARAVFDNARTVQRLAAAEHARNSRRSQ